jgi:hypothetical protein
MKLTKIMTNLTAIAAEALLNNMSEAEIQKAESLDVVSFDVVENDLVTMYVFHKNAADLETILESFREHSITYSTEDMTEKALFGMSNVQDDIFNCELNRWLAQNVTIDTVLDKISKFGKDSLNENDQQLLANF